MKLLVTISSPAISESYDIWVPATLKVGTIIPLITHALEEISNGRYVSSGKECLCSVENHTYIDPFSTLSDSEIKTGDHLIIL